MKVLIADKFESSGIHELEKLGCTVVSDPDLGPDTLPAAMNEHDPDILIVRSTKVPEPVFEAAGALALVIRAGAGYDTIDVAAASRRAISIANCPGKNSVAVAELTWGLIIALDRKIAQQTADLRDGVWNKKGYAKAQGLKGRTLGIIGTGQIGREVIKRARAFEMPVLAWSRSLTDETALELGVTRAASPIDVAKSAEIVSLHVAATPETKGMANAEFFAAMQSGAMLINTTRGSLIDEAALIKAMDDKGIVAGLDVYNNEPGASDKAFDSALAKHPSVIGTHHIGASTDQAQQAIAGEAVRIVRVYAETGEISNVVNRKSASDASRLLVVRHQNQPGVLAHVIGRISEANVNIEEMENVIFRGNKGACAKIRLGESLSQEIIAAITDGSAGVLSVELTEIG